MTQYRQPTIAEAVENICRESHTRAFRNHSINFYRIHYGDKYADEVKARATEILLKRKPVKGEV